MCVIPRFTQLAAICFMMSNKNRRKAVCSRLQCVLTVHAPETDKFRYTNDVSEVTSWVLKGVILISTHDNMQFNN